VNSIHHPHSDRAENSGSSATSRQEWTAKPRKWKKLTNPICGCSRDCSRRPVLVTALVVGLFSTPIALRARSMSARRSAEGSIKVAAAVAGVTRFPSAFVSEANL
jgi:hypothetical protein